MHGLLLILAITHKLGVDVVMKGQNNHLDLILPIHLINLGAPPGALEDKLKCSQIFSFYLYKLIKSY